MRTTIIGLCLMALFPLSAQAQTGRHFALGAQVGVREFVDNSFSKKNPSFSVLYRVSRSPSERRQGWVWRLGGTAGYSHTDFNTDVGGTDTKIGNLREIPVMGGVERAYRHDRLKVGLSVLGGPSYNKFSIDNSARTAYEARLGVPLEDIKVKNSVAIRSGLGVWYDVNRWVGLHTGIYYLYGRPKATITAGGVSSTETWKTDHVGLSLGMAIGIF